MGYLAAQLGDASHLGGAADHDNACREQVPVTRPLDFLFDELKRLVKSRFGDVANVAPRNGRDLISTKRRDLNELLRIDARAQRISVGELNLFRLSKRRAQSNRDIVG